MQPRLNLFTAAPELTQKYLEFSNQVMASGIEPDLLKLMEIRASQVNGCANCLNMHTFEARKEGETDQRLHLLAAWREAPVYSDRERAALAWTEYLTLVADRSASDDPHTALDAQFTKEEQVKLTMMIIVINGWNRLACGFEIFEPSLGWR